jgi:peptidoglycan/xylan/chitin deacetylase (PgdA/CDA1 family)
MGTFQHQACNCTTQEEWKLTLKDLQAGAPCNAWEGYSLTVRWNGTRWEGYTNCTQKSWLLCEFPEGGVRTWSAMVMGKIEGEEICILEAQGHDSIMHCQNGGRLNGIACRCVGDTGYLQVEPVSGPTKYYVYLTFDDGPRYGTDDCIAVLNAKNIKGTFFMIGAHMDSAWFEQRVRDAHQGGHLIGNHSYSHWLPGPSVPDPYADPPTGKTNAEWFQDYAACDARIAVILELPTGTKFPHARLPGKKAWRVCDIRGDDGNSQRVADHIGSNGYKIYGWDGEWRYEWRIVNGERRSYPIETPEEMADIVKNRLLAGQTVLPRKFILLTHDHMFRATSGNRVKLEQFIDRLKEILPDVEFRRVDTFHTD